MRARRSIPPQLVNCPVRNVLDRMSDRWSVLVLRELAPVDAMRFSVLRRAIGDISQRVLAQTLRRLEEDGYVSRTVYPTIPPRVDYALTPLGRSLWECVTPLIAWAHANQKKVKAARTRYVPPPQVVAL